MADTSKRISELTEALSSIGDDFFVIVRSGSNFKIKKDNFVPQKSNSSEVDTGTDDNKYVTPKSLKDSHNVPSVAPGLSGNLLVSNGIQWISALPKTSGSAIDNGVDDTNFVTPKALKDSNNIPNTAPGAKDNVIVSNGNKWISLNRTDSGLPNGKATGEDVDNGTNDTKYVTPKAIFDSAKILQIDEIPEVEGYVLTWNGAKWTPAAPTGASGSGVTAATGSVIDQGIDNIKMATAKALKDSHNVPSVTPGNAGNVLMSNGTDWISSPLGSMASQNSNDVNITGGSISGANITGGSISGVDYITLEEGDIIYRGQFGNTRLAAGASNAGKILALNSNGTAPEWVNNEGGHIIQDEGVTLTKRSILNFVGTGVTVSDTGEKTQVAIPSVSSDPVWNSAGDIVYATGDNTATVLPIGTAGQVLKVNQSGTAPEWGTVSSGGNADYLGVQVFCM